MRLYCENIHLWSQTNRQDQYPLETVLRRLHGCLQVNSGHRLLRQELHFGIKKAEASVLGHRADSEIGIVESSRSLLQRNDRSHRRLFCG